MDWSVGQGLTPETSIEFKKTFRTDDLDILTQKQFKFEFLTHALFILKIVATGYPATWFEHSWTLESSLSLFHGK